MQNNSYFDNDPFAKDLGILLTRQEEKFARCEMTLQEHHKNGLGTPHGAVIFALADITFAAACNNQQISIGVQADIRYMSKPSGSRLIAEAAPVSESNKLGHYVVAISDDTGQQVAQFTSVAYRLSAKA